MVDSKKHHAVNCKQIVLLSFGMTFGFTFYAYSYVDFADLNQYEINFHTNKSESSLKDENYNKNKAIALMNHDEMEILKNSSKRRTYPKPYRTR